MDHEEPKFSRKEIAEYISGWVTAPFDEVSERYKHVYQNAINQLWDDQDGIQAVIHRNKN